MSVIKKARFIKKIKRNQIAHLFIPLSIVSRTSDDDSCKYVLVLADEKPEIADDSEIEDRLDWLSVVDGTTIFRPKFLSNTHVFIFIQQVTFLCAAILSSFWSNFLCKPKTIDR